LSYLKFERTFLVLKSNRNHTQLTWKTQQVRVAQTWQQQNLIASK